MIGRIIACCAGALWLTMPAVAAEKHPHLKIIIETVAHERYRTVGDWQVKPDGLHVTVSKMSDQRYEFLIGMHEAIEAYLAVHAGISPAAVDKFDEAYESRRQKGDDKRAGRRSQGAVLPAAPDCDGD
jgi:hypothetical protein